MSGPVEGGPTVRRIVLGHQLRRLRESRALTREAAGDAVDGSGSKISRMELGRVSFKEQDVRALLRFYGVDEREHEGLLAMARNANEPGWWHRYGELVPSWFQNYVGLEEAATRIQTYEVRIVPGLLQTEEYAWWVVRQGLPEADDAEVRRRVRLRMARQEALPEQTRVWAVVDEAALHRVVGDRAVMRRQLEHLVQLWEANRVTFQVVPFAAGNYSAEHAFTLLRFAEPALPDIVYMEYLNGSLYLDKRSEVELYTKVTHQLAVEARTPQDSCELLRELSSRA